MVVLDLEEWVVVVLVLDPEVWVVVVVLDPAGFLDQLVVVLAALAVSK